LTVRFQIDFPALAARLAFSRVFCVPGFARKTIPGADGSGN